MSAAGSARGSPSRRGVHRQPLHRHRTTARSPAASSTSRCRRSVSARSMAAAVSAGCVGSNVADGSRRISGSDEVSEQMTAAPHAAASTTGKPKPSSSDGWTTRWARCSSTIICWSGTLPAKFISTEATGRRGVAATGRAATPAARDGQGMANPELPANQRPRGDQALGVLARVGSGHGHDAEPVLIRVRLLELGETPAPITAEDRVETQVVDRGVGRTARSRP